MMCSATKKSPVLVATPLVPFLAAAWVGVQPDPETVNGVIHAIDSVMLPEVLCL